MTDYDLANLKLINAQKEEEHKVCSDAFNLIRNYVLNQNNDNERPHIHLPKAYNCNFKPLIDEINKSKFVKIEQCEGYQSSWISRNISSLSDVVNYKLHTNSF